MSQLPVTADIDRAIEVWDARIDALTGGGDGMCAGVVETVDGAHGEGLVALRQACGDLFDPAEFIDRIGVKLIHAALEDAVRERDAGSAVATAVLQAAALGVLIERARWER
jgi:hypothetical protein